MQPIFYDNIEEFIKIKQRCVFCKSPLRCILTNFEGLGKRGIPLLKSPVKPHFPIAFNVNKTTAKYSVQAEGAIDIRTNGLVFQITNPYNIPHLAPNGEVREAEPTACEAFLDMKPYIQMYCPSKSCDMAYALSSSVFTVARVSKRKSKNFSWIINPLKLWMETFSTQNLTVVNDWIYNSTNIYSRNNPDADAITVSLIDFESMEKSKLITRVQTFVTFS